MRTDTEAARSLFDLIIRMLEYDPAERITLDQALDHAFFKSEEARSLDDAKLSLCKFTCLAKVTLLFIHDFYSLISNKNSLCSKTNIPTSPEVAVDMLSEGK